MSNPNLGKSGILEIKIYSIWCFLRNKIIEQDGARSLLLHNPRMEKTGSRRSMQGEISIETWSCHFGPESQSNCETSFLTLQGWWRFLYFIKAERISSTIKGLQSFTRSRILIMLWTNHWPTSALDIWYLEWRDLLAFDKLVGLRWRTCTPTVRYESNEHFVAFG